MATISTWIPWETAGLGPVDRAWRWVRLIGMLYALGCLFFLLNQAAGLVRSHADVAVPLVVGQKQSDAIRLLRHRGLNPIAEEGDRSDGYHAGSVMQQSLPAGMAVREGRAIYLLVCTGPLHVTLPDVRARSRNAAALVLVQLGLQPSMNSTITSRTVPFDQVVEQFPPPGSRVEIGSAIGLVTSDGPPDEDATAEVDDWTPEAGDSPGRRKPAPMEEWKDSEPIQGADLKPPAAGERDQSPGDRQPSPQPPVAVDGYPPGTIAGRQPTVPGYYGSAYPGNSNSAVQSGPGQSLYDGSPVPVRADDTSITGPGSQLVPVPGEPISTPGATHRRRPGRPGRPARRPAVQNPAPSPLEAERGPVSGTGVPPDSAGSPAGGLVIQDTVPTRDVP